MSLFHRYDYIYRPLSGTGTWLTATTGWKLTDTDILKAAACVHSKFFLGARAGKSCRFAVLDIDARSKYHNARQLKRIISTLSAAGLRKHVLFRSSHSGGWHLYLFFAEPLNSRELHQLLHKLLTNDAYSIAKGQLEIFPNPGQYGSLGYGLRLPLQPGFAWLDKETQQVQHERDDMHALEAMGMFSADYYEHLIADDEFELFKSYTENLQERKRAISLPQQREKKTVGIITAIPKKTSAPESDQVALIKTAFLGRIPPNINVLDWLKGRAYFESGLTAPGQRADAIFCLGHYLFYGDPEHQLNALGYGYEKEREWLIEKMLAAKHNNNSNDINNARQDAFEHIARATHWQPSHRRDSEQKKFLPHGKSNIVWIKANAKRKTEARKKITAAVFEFRAAGKPFSIRQLRQKSGCSQDGLYNNKDIWHQDYEDLASGFFAADPGECNAVKGGNPPEIISLPPEIISLSFSNDRIVPLGLLAARQIAYEISMRVVREKTRHSRQTVKQKEDNERSWNTQVFAALEEALDPNQTIPKLKTLLAFLIFMLMSAPTEEDAINLQAQIAIVKSCLHHLTKSIKLTLVADKTIRPPPPG